MEHFPGPIRLISHRLPSMRERLGGAGWGRQMYQTTTNPKRLNLSVWSAIFVTTQTFQRTLPFVAVLVLTGILIACTGDLPEADQTVAPTSSSVPVPTTAPEPTVALQPVDTPELVRSDKSRDESPDATAEEFAELVDGNSAFAFDLYHALRDASDGNLFYSPYSISLALAMTYAGARGETESQMADSLHLTLPQDRLHTSFNLLDIELASMSDVPLGQGGGFRLNTVNAVWGQQGYEFLEPFLDVLAENYGAGVRPADFKDEDAREESRLAINDWVADQTEDRIKNLVPPDAFNAFTRMVLTNAIYFNAFWSRPFSEAPVMSFHRLDGRSANVPMMAGSTRNYGSGDGYQAVSVPYTNRRVSMTIVLPDLGRFEEIESSLDATRAGQILEGIGPVEGSVALTMPKFEFDSRFKLAETLKAMGMPNAFDREASEFQGMDGQSCLAGDIPCLFISDVLHKAFVSVDEEGTEAAAATAVIVEQEVTKGARVPIIPVVVDRPFIFLIRDEETGAILFLGSVVELGDESWPTPTQAPQPTPVPDELRSSKKRSAPAATGGDLAELVSGNSAFAFDLYRTLAEEDGNLFYSPYSISVALAMTYAGARGETERQMADTLHYLLPQGRLHTSFNSLDLELASMADAPEDEGDAFTLNLANAVWGQHDYEFLAPFLDVLAENYGAGVRPTDFVGSPEESRVRINDWVAEQTEDKVKDLIPEGAIDGSTRMVLTNAIYFNARWFHPFFKHLTSARPFRLLDGSEVDVPMMMMAAAERLGYADGDGYQAVELPYRGRDMWMTILLPDAGTFREFEESMDADLVAGILGDIEREYVELTMPKFEFESEFSLKETLKAMGMPNAFDGFTADFSGMDGRSCPGVCLLISDAFHKAFVSVDEEGTEAAAATGIVVILESARPPPKKVMVDRPFIFLIRDRATDVILFVGRVENPVG